MGRVRMRSRGTVVAALTGVAGLLAGVAIGVGGPASAAPATSAGPATGTADRVVDLSHVNDPATTPLFPGDPPFTLTTAFTVPADGFYLQYVKEGEHTGTHWGAPCHFHTDEVCADRLDPADLYLPAVKIDIRAKAAANADYQLTVADIQAWEAQNGRIPNGAAIVLWTNWSARWGTPAYANLDADGVIHQPGFSKASVQWLIATGRLGYRGALGTDTFGPDPGTDEDFNESSLVFHRHRIDLENLDNLGALPTTGAKILVGGPINKNGSGSPATIWGLF